jgi:hypothetical protein
VAPGDGEILTGLYRSYAELGRSEEAANVIERWLQFNPDDSSARALLADLRRGRAAPPGSGSTNPR